MIEQTQEYQNHTGIDAFNLFYSIQHQFGNKYSYHRNGDQLVISKPDKQYFGEIMFGNDIVKISLSDSVGSDEKETVAFLDNLSALLGK